MQKLECRALSAAYGKKSVLHNVSFEVARGEFVCLCGPNGSGKSTLLSLLAGLPVGGLRVTSGELVPDLRGRGLRGGASRGVTCGGVTCRGVPRKEAARLVAYLQQNETCAWDFPVLEYVVQGRFSYTVNGNYSEDDYKVARESLGLLGLGEFAERSVHALSGGEFQKVRIARAVAQRPAFLLLDEPAAGMNPQEAAELCDFIRDIRQKYDLSIFLIEHHMDLVMNISDYIYVIDFGSEIAEGKPDEVQHNQKVINAYLGASDE